ncbi:MAG: hypothetical protein NTX49_01375 [Chlamydiae bacterium]|nr:hypothetical protein [Chlamydiota bacterium]
MKVAPLFFSFCFLLAGGLHAQPDEVDMPEDAGVEDLSFSSDAEQYFSEELSLPGGEETAENIEKRLRATLKIDTSYEENGAWKVVFTFPKNVTFTEKSSEHSLYLHFNQNIDSKDLPRMEEKLGFLLKSISTGYNSLYLVTERNATFASEASGATFTLTLTPDYTVKPAPTPSLKTAYARLMMEKRHYVPALCEIFSLLEKKPCDKDVQVLLADTEGLLPLWKKQMQTFDSLQEQYPHDADLRLLAAEAKLPHTPFIQVGSQVQDTLMQATLFVFPVKGEAVLQSSPQNTLFGGMQYQLWDGYINSLVNTQGNLVSFQGVRNQGKVYLRNETDTGSRYSGSFYMQEGGVIGGGAEGSWLWPIVQGDFTVTADWHRPYWEVYEAYAYHGREDKALFNMNSTVNRRVTYSLGGGGRRVGIEGTPTGFTSALAQAQLFYFWSIKNPDIAFNYSFNAEYILYLNQKTGADGLPYNPVPYQSFEQHTFLIYFFYKLRHHWNFTLYGGGTFNRLGLNSPTSGASAIYRKPTPSGLEIELSVDQFPNTAAGGAIAIFYTAVLRARF